MAAAFVLTTMVKDVPSIHAPKQRTGTLRIELIGVLENNSWFGKLRELIHLASGYGFELLTETLSGTSLIPLLPTALRIEVVDHG